MSSCSMPRICADSCSRSRARRLSENRHGAAMAMIMRRPFTRVHLAPSHRSVPTSAQPRERMGEDLTTIRRSPPPPRVPVAMSPRLKKRSRSRVSYPVLFLIRKFGLPEVAKAAAGAATSAA